MNELSTINQDLINQANMNMPANDGFRRRIFPRIGFQTQDKTEGKGKAMTVVAEAGTYHTEVETPEIDENGKSVWSKTDLGKSFEGTVVYYRKKLSMYDEATQKYTSSPLYDDETDVISLFCDKQKIATGTATELKKLYMVAGTDGKMKSKLQEMRVLYVLYGGELYELSIKGTSMYSFLDYARKCNPSLFICEFSSKERENGATQWNETTFRNVRPVTEDELTTIVGLQGEIREGIAMEKAYFASKNAPKEETMQEAMNEFTLPPVTPEF